MKIYDLSVILSDDVVVYGNDFGVKITESADMSRGDRYNSSILHMGNHSGTHADAPKHFIDDGLTCDVISLEHFIGPAKVFDLRRVLKGRRLVEEPDLRAFDIQAGDIILLNTGNSPLMRQKEFTRDYVSLSIDAAKYLAKNKIKTLGIDYLSVEAGGGAEKPVHKTLLGNNIAVLEGLVFDAEGGVPQGNYFLSALPLKIRNGNGSPVRAVLLEKRKAELVIFDMDGLMLDTEPVSVEAWKKAGKVLGFEMPDEFFEQLYGCNKKLARQRVKAYLGENFDYETSSALRTKYFDKHIAENGVAVKPGLLEMLDMLDKQGIKKCVATSTDKEKALLLLEMAGLAGRFETVIGGDGIVNSKPHPEIFLKSASAFDADPENCIVLEDSAAGAEAAYQADMRCILVPDMVQPNNETLAKVSAVCGDLHEAACLIDRWADN